MVGHYFWVIFVGGLYLRLTNSSPEKYDVFLSSTIYTPLIYIRACLVVFVNCVLNGYICGLDWYIFGSVCRSQSRCRCSTTTVFTLSIGFSHIRNSETWRELSGALFPQHMRHMSSRSYKVAKPWSCCYQNNSFHMPCVQSDLLGRSGGRRCLQGCPNQFRP